MFASVFITVKSVQAEIAKGFNVSDLFKNSVFSTLIVSMASTYVLWFVVSFIFFDPWHMFTSFIQYLLMTPTYINILNVYAFCNTHDITWGTKGDTKPEKLGGIKAGSDGKFKVDLPTDEADLNTQYEKELNEFARPYKPPVKPPGDDDKKDDYYKGFRSVIVLAWMFTNLALCSVVLQTGGMQVVISQNKSAAEQSADNNAKIYLSVVLWSVAGLSAFRFLGAMWFLIVRLVSGPNPSLDGWLTLPVPRHLGRLASLSFFCCDYCGRDCPPGGKLASGQSLHDTVVAKYPIGCVLFSSDQAFVQTGALCTIIRSASIERCFFSALRPPSSG